MGTDERDTDLKASVLGTRAFEFFEKLFPVFGDLDIWTFGLLEVTCLGPLFSLAKANTTLFTRFLAQIGFLVSRPLTAQPMTGCPPPPTGPVIVENGGEMVLDGSDASYPSTAGEWLTRWQPAGVYTATRTFVGAHGEKSVYQWTEHVARLRDMLLKLRENDVGGFPKDCVIPHSDSEMDALVRDTVRVALRSINKADAVHKAPPDADHKSPDASASGASRSESMIVLVVSPTLDGTWKVGAHAVPLPWSTNHQNPAVCVVAKNAARSNPEVKHTGWPSARGLISTECTHQFRNSGPFDEILLADQTGENIAEGGVTNFFVVLASGSGGGDNAGSRGDAGAPLRGGDTVGSVGTEDVGSVGNDIVVSRGIDKPTVRVQTAPTTRCLAGIGRASVLEACLALRIDVELVAPKIRDASEWREAFLTNAVRGLRPVGRVRWVGCDGTFREKVFKDVASHSVINCLVEHMAKQTD